MAENTSKETYSVPPEGHILVKNMWSDSQVVQRYRTRGRLLPHTQTPKNAQNFFWENRAWYQARRHGCAKARLRNPNFFACRDAMLVGVFLVRRIFEKEDKSQGECNVMLVREALIYCCNKHFMCISDSAEVSFRMHYINICINELFLELFSAM